MIASHNQLMTTHSSFSENTKPELYGARLLTCLFNIGWSERMTAERLEMHRTILKRCIDGKIRLDAERSRKLLIMEQAYLSVFTRSLESPR